MGGEFRISCASSAIFGHGTGHVACLEIVKVGEALEVGFAVFGEMADDSEGKFDGLLLSIAQQHSGIDEVSF